MTLRDQIFEKPSDVRRDGQVVKYEVRPEHRKELARIERETGMGIYALFGELFSRVRQRLPRLERAADKAERAKPFIKALLDAKEINGPTAKQMGIARETEAALAELNVERSDAGLPVLVRDVDDSFSRWMSRAEVYRIVKARYKRERVCPLDCASNQTRFWRRWVRDTDVDVVTHPEHPNLVRINVAELQGILHKLNGDDFDELFGR